ncbi:MAG: hypothetical protein AAB368_07195, partial [bacterium]
RHLPGVEENSSPAMSMMVETLDEIRRVTGGTALVEHHQGKHDAAGAPTYARGKKWPASALLAIPFAILMALLVPVVRKLVRWRACWLTVLAFEVIMLPVEHAARR